MRDEIGRDDRSTPASLLESFLAGTPAIASLIVSGGHARHSCAKRCGRGQGFLLRRIGGLAEDIPDAFAGFFECVAKTLNCIFGVID